MKLLIDLQGLQNGSRNRGIGRYATSLTRSILRHVPPNDVTLLLSNLFPNTIEPAIASLSDLVSRDRFVFFNGIGPAGAVDSANSWRSAASHELYEKFVADIDPDVLLIGSLFEGGSDNTIVTVSEARRRYLVAVILYDLIPLLNPAEHIGSRNARQWYFGKVEKARKADLLLGISASACREAIEYLPSDSEHVIEIGAAASDEFALENCAELTANARASDLLAYHGITKPFLMHTSAFDARKNFKGLIRAFALLPDDVKQRHQLVLVCKLNNRDRLELLDTIAQAGLKEDDVILTGFVPDDELRMLYASCALFVFPSFHEGFGLPVIEAMWCGAPAIGSSLSSVPEVIGREDALFDPHDVEGMARLIHRSLNDGAFRQSLLEHAAQHARSFSWDNVANRALAAIKSKLAATSGTPLNDGSGYFAMDQVINRIVRTAVLPGPSDKELMCVAEAMDANERACRPPSER
jgi:glycosyltransferase involved in cell wall biosynthesis